MIENEEQSISKLWISDTHTHTKKNNDENEIPIISINKCMFKKLL